MAEKKVLTAEERRKLQDEQRKRDNDNVKRSYRLTKGKPT